MAQKEIRDLVMGLDTASQDFGAAKQNLAQQKLQGLREQFLRDMPGQLQASGLDPSTAGFITQGAASGDQKFQDLAAQAILKRSLPDANKAPQTFDQLKNVYGAQLDEPTLKGIAALRTPQEQEKAITFHGGVLGRKQKDEIAGANLESRDTRTEYTQPKNRFFQDTTKEIAAHDKELEAARRAQESLKMGEVPSDSVAINFVMRVIGGEKGRIPVQERGNFIAHQVGGDAQKWQNYLENGDATVLTSAQRETFRKLLDNAVQNSEQFKNQRIGSALNDFISSHSGHAIDSGTGKLDKDLEQFGKRHGFTYNPGTGEVSAPTVESKLTGDYAKAFEGTKNLPPGKREQAQKVIQDLAKKGTPIPANRLQQLGVQ